MYYEKGKLIFRRIFWLLAAIVMFSLPFILEALQDDYEISFGKNFDVSDVVYLSFTLGSFAAVLFINALFFLSCKRYYYNNQKIVVYAGILHHYIKVDDEKCDEHTTLMRFIPIKLATSLADGSLMECTISTINRIATKINGRLYRNKKQKS